MQTTNVSTEKEPTEQLTLSAAEYSALDGIYGLHPLVHSMVMLATPDAKGRWTLEGTQDAFDALQSDLSDEIYHEVSPQTQLKHLRRLYARLSPDEFL